MDGGIMNKIFIVKLTQDNAEILEATPLNKEYNGRVMVKILKTGFIYYERTDNIGTTREDAEKILFQKISHLCACAAAITKRVMMLNYEKPV